MKKPGRKKIVTKDREEDKISNGHAGTMHTMEKSHLDDDAVAVGSMIVEDNALQCSNGLPPQKKHLRTTNVNARRSGCNQSSVFSAAIQGAKPAMGCIDLVENDKKEAVHCQKASEVPVFTENDAEKRPQVQEADGVPDTNLLNLEVKIDCLLDAIDEFKSQMPRRPNESQSGELNYKDLYIHAERKIEALMSENFELVKKLEYARGELSTYRTVTKDSMSTLKGATETMIGLLPQPARPLGPHDLKEKSHSKTDPGNALADAPKENKNKRRKC